MFAGFNDMGLCDTTSESMFQKYMIVGYKGTGTETINNICMFTDSELTALLSMEAFDKDNALPEPSPRQRFTTNYVLPWNRKTLVMFL